MKMILLRTLDMWYRTVLLEAAKICYEFNIDVSKLEAGDIIKLLECAFECVVVGAESCEDSLSTGGFGVGIATANGDSLHTEYTVIRPRNPPVPNSPVGEKEGIEHGKDTNNG